MPALTEVAFVACGSELMIAACSKADTDTSLGFSVLLKKRKHSHVKAESNAQVSIHIQLTAD